MQQNTEQTNTATSIRVEVGGELGGQLPLALKGPDLVAEVDHVQVGGGRRA